MAKPTAPCCRNNVLSTGGYTKDDPAGNIFSTPDSRTGQPVFVGADKAVEGSPGRSRNRRAPWEELRLFFYNRRATQAARSVTQSIKAVAAASCRPNYRITKGSVRSPRMRRRKSILQSIEPRMQQYQMQSPRWAIAARRKSPYPLLLPFKRNSVPPGNTHAMPFTPAVNASGNSQALPSAPAVAESANTQAIPFTPAVRVPANESGLRHAFVDSGIATDVLKARIQTLKDQIQDQHRLQWQQVRFLPSDKQLHEFDEMKRGTLTIASNSSLDQPEPRNERPPVRKPVFARLRFTCLFIPVFSVG